MDRAPEASPPNPHTLSEEENFGPFPVFWAHSECNLSDSGQLIFLLKISQKY